LTNAAAATHTHSINTDHTGGAYVFGLDVGVLGHTDDKPNHNHGGATGADGDHNHAISSDASWRVSAAVFTMQYLDM
jgi:hypothetical protein